MKEVVPNLDIFVLSKISIKIAIIALKAKFFQMKNQFHFFLFKRLRLSLVDAINFIIEKSFISFKL